MIDAPCRKCTTETGRCADPNCHGYCEKFLKWKEDFEEEKKVKQKELILNNYYITSRRNRTAKYNMRKCKKEGL